MAHRLMNCRTPPRRGKITATSSFHALMDDQRHYYGSLSDEDTAASEPPLEVTHEEFMRNVGREDHQNHASSSSGNSSPRKATSRGRTSSSSSGRGGVRRLTKSLKMGAARSIRKSASASNTDFACSKSFADNVSVASGNKSLQSAANYTLASLDTIKASNKTNMMPDATTATNPGSASKKEKKQARWGKLKQRFMGTKKSSSLGSHDDDDDDWSNRSVESNIPRRQRAKTEDDSTSVSSSSSSNHLGGKRRVRSTPNAAAAAMDHHTATSKVVSLEEQEQQAMVDVSIRGRFDGVDILYLGDAQFGTLSNGGGDDDDNDTTASPWDSALRDYTFTGQPLQWSTTRMVLEMMQTSAGRDPPELILEGMIPGPDGRWSVRVVQEQEKPKSVEKKKKKAQNDTTGGRSSSSPWWNFDSTPPPPLQPTASEDCETSEDDGGSPMTPHRLWNSLWGPNPAPAELTYNLQGSSSSGSNSTAQQQQRQERDDNSNEHDDPMHNLAVRCSIPIDIDENTFIVTTREHVAAINEIAGVNLANGNLAVAFRMFDTLRRSLDAIAKIPSDLRFVKGANLHNMGLLQLWMGQYGNAVDSFQRAVDERIKRLPQCHPDIAVSLVRKADACFAVGELEASKTALNTALPMIPPNHSCLAKILNNLGVVCYQQRDYIAALKNFSKAVEIQRLWLEGSGRRRETSVFDAAVTLLNMGKLYLERSDFDLAVSMFEEALLLQTSIFRKDHDMILATRLSLGVAKAQNGDSSKAMQIFLGCLRSQDKRFGPLSPGGVETLGLSGCHYAKQGDFEHAFNCFTAVRTWQKANLSDRHPAMLKSKDIIRAIEANKGKGSKVWI